MNDNHRQSDDGSMNDKDPFSGISFEDNPAEDQNTSFGNDLNSLETVSVKRTVSEF